MLKGTWDDVRAALIVAGMIAATWLVITHTPHHMEIYLARQIRVAKLRIELARLQEEQRRLGVDRPEEGTTPIRPAEDKGSTAISPAGQ